MPVTLQLLMHMVVQRICANLLLSHVCGSLNDCDESGFIQPSQGLAEGRWGGWRGCSHLPEALTGAPSLLFWKIAHVTERLCLSFSFYPLPLCRPFPFFQSHLLPSHIVKPPSGSTFMSSDIQSWLALYLCDSPGLVGTSRPPTPQSPFSLSALPVSVLRVAYSLLGSLSLLPHSPVLLLLPPGNNLTPPSPHRYLDTAEHLSSLVSVYLLSTERNQRGLLKMEMAVVSDLFSTYSSSNNCFLG